MAMHASTLTISQDSSRREETRNILSYSSTSFFFVGGIPLIGVSHCLLVRMTESKQTTKHRTQHTTFSISSLDYYSYYLFIVIGRFSSPSLCLASYCSITGTETVAYTYPYTVVVPASVVVLRGQRSNSIDNASAALVSAHQKNNNNLHVVWKQQVKYIYVEARELHEPLASSIHFFFLCSGFVSLLLPAGYTGECMPDQVSTPPPNPLFRLFLQTVGLSFGVLMVAASFPFSRGKKTNKKKTSKILLSSLHATQHKRKRSIKQTQSEHHTTHKRTINQEEYGGIEQQTTKMWAKKRKYPRKHEPELAKLQLHPEEGRTPQALVVSSCHS
eukprot:gene11041-7674_t